MSTQHQATPNASALALDRVRRRVAAIGFFAVAIHGVLGCVGVAKVLQNQGRGDDGYALLVMSGIIALLTYGVMRLILGRSLWSPAWMALAMVPTVAGVIWLSS